MSIQPDTLLAQIDLDALPRGTEKAVYLPSDAARAAAHLNVITFNQQRLIAQYVKGRMTPTMTWADAVNAVRVEAGLTPKQYDFGMAAHISQVWDTETATDEMTPGQLNLTVELIAVLSGQKDHRDGDITKAVKARGSVVANSLMVRFVTATTKGEFNAALKMFNAVYGFPKPFTEATLAAAGSISTSGDITSGGANISPNEDGSVDPATDSEEPF